MSKVAIIIPTRNRSQHLLERFRVLERSTPELFNGIASVYIAMDIDDVKTYEVLHNHFPQFRPFMHDKEEIPAIKWNKTAAQILDAEWFVTLSDDSLPHPRWLTNALGTINKGFIGLPDGVTNDRNNEFTPLYMATRKWLKTYNGGVLVIPAYKSWYADMETAQRAHRSGTYFVSKYSVVEQLHEVFGTAEPDEIYAIGSSRRIIDFKTYAMRLRNGFPNDFEAVL